jgi:type II secretory pathway pseudopilin PulG
MRSQAGFSLVESLVATALMLTVSGAAFALMMPGLTGSSVQAEAADMQQRLRVAGDGLQRDLRMAGAGYNANAGAGSLIRFFAPILPRRVGRQAPDAYTVVREDAVAIVYGSESLWQTTAAAPLTAGPGSLRVDARPSCPAGRPVCGYTSGLDLLVFDRAGLFDRFTVTSVVSDDALLRAHRSDVSSSYQTGAFVMPAETHVYWFDAAARQLRHYDGDGTDVPVVDNVVGLRFEYFGDPNPPSLPRPPAGVANCLYDTAGAQLSMPTLVPDGSSLAPLPLALLADGPWCGEGLNRFDADLLRVRKVRVTLRIQAAQASLRATGPAYAVPGTSTSAQRALPDLGVTFDVTPRNLSEVR